MTNFKTLPPTFRVDVIDVWIHIDGSFLFLLQKDFYIAHEHIGPFCLIVKYNWRGINYLSKIDDWKAFDKNNPTFALSILYIKGKEICPAYISKINSNCK